MSNEFGTNVDGPAVLPEIKYEPAVIRDPPKPRQANGDPIDNRPRTRIVLEENDNIPPTGQFFGAQGIGMMLKPGLPADVPATIIDILNNAIMATPVVDPTTKQVLGFKNRLRFPYSVLPVEKEAA